MHVTLFRALRSANIAENAAEKVVHAFEEHIDMAVAEARRAEVGDHRKARS